MPSYNSALVEKVNAALASIPEDARPRWGKMNRAQLYGHLHMALRYSMGEGPKMPYRGNFVSRHIFRRLILAGLVEIPHNVRLPRPEGMKEMPPPPEATFEQVSETLREFLRRLEAGTLPVALHPFFGPMSGREWGKFHCAHLKHHCKQFGVWN
jgi:hypothetical protein